jgi:hypothetical protein
MIDTSIYNIIGSGSYRSDDVVFLLKEMDLAPTDVEEKERLIQSGEKHYSEMISVESPPSTQHMALYQKALAQNAQRMASEVLALANCIANEIPEEPIILVSLVRAGLPLGVLLKRTLSSTGRMCYHYGVSVIRDKGIDKVAMDTIADAHGTNGIVFVDGWTGKGAISGEIKRSLGELDGFPAEPRLCVLADPCGRAWLAASSDDWIIPSGILGATVSGLVSRSIWPNDGGLHGCVRYHHLASLDQTRSFIDIILNEMTLLHTEGHHAAAPWTEAQRHYLQRTANSVIDSIACKYEITNRNRVKPGIAEATRAVMRRIPEHVLVRSKNDPDVRLLLHLTDQAGIKAEEVGTALGPYRALTVIKRVN